MSKRKKRRRKPAAASETGESSVPFNPAFRESVPVEEKIPAEEGLRTAEQEVQESVSPGQDTLFLRAMADVAPLKTGKTTVVRYPDPHVRPPHSVRDEEMETMAHLSDLVAGNAEMDIAFSDEYMEGCIHGLDPRVMRALRKGNFPFQDYIDLHGLTRQEAMIRLKGFLVQSRALGKRCVLVIHGRGLNSENKVGVLRDNLPLWLGKGPLKRIILAFCTARPYDGGTGAAYILLRKLRRR